MKIYFNKRFLDFLDSLTMQEHWIAGEWNVYCKDERILTSCFLIGPEYKVTKKCYKNDFILN